MRASGGIYPKETQDVLKFAHKVRAGIAQIVLSHCHRDDTVANVIERASNQTELSKILISRKPTGDTGKLSVLQSLFSLDTPVYHIDDSPEVIEEFKWFLQSNKSCVWKIVGIFVPKKQVIPGISYCKNVGEALDLILQRSGLASQT